MTTDQIDIEEAINDTLSETDKLESKLGRIVGAMGNILLDGNNIDTMLLSLGAAMSCVMRLPDPPLDSETIRKYFTYFQGEALSDLESDAPNLYRDMLGKGRATKIAKEETN